MKVKPLIICCCLFFLFFISFPLKAATYHRTPPTVWDVLRKQFMLDHDAKRPEVQAQIQWLLKRPDYLKRFAHAEPYMYHILNEVKQQNLPGEIALVPIIESAFDPFAYSGVGAAGLWQIMPETGFELGLKRNWWIEPRRSIAPSTDAALKYYTYLNKFFKGNWLLAFAAYDSGEGNVARAIRRSGQSRENAQFWSLKLPKETRIYVPRLLALAEIIEHPARYQIELPPILYQPYFEEVDVGRQIDLSHAAKLAGISYQDFIKLNPGYNRWATSPHAPHKVLLPTAQVKTFMQNLAKLPKDTQLAWARHKVKPGESLSVIAQNYRTTAALIKNFNHLKSDTLKKGQYLLVPNQMHIPQMAKNKAPAITIPEPNIPEHDTYKVVHIVQKKDSFETLQKKYGASEASVRAWNHLGKERPLQPGQKLMIWKKQNAGRYVVKAGDSLGRIAERQHISMKRLRALNPNIKPDLIKPGQVLQIS